ncbi:GntR family transcriptional regulator [Bauldia sp.]|uniref:GntR family transcriptional regulator n=1 Tax=Bauldia sp. TaxID=2575872 RepID=UPI003BAD6E16
MPSRYIEISDRIREDIVSGKFAGGERLKLAELASLYSTSHMPIREALRILNGQGIVEFIPNSGMRVREIDMDFMTDLFDVRLALEAIQARRAAERLMPAAADAISAAKAEFERVSGGNDRDATLKANHRFHRAISLASGNHEAGEIEERHYQILRIVWRRFGYGSERLEGVIEDHRLLTSAILDQDVEAAGLIAAAHVTRARLNLAANMEKAENVSHLGPDREQIANNGKT